jgi:hypothetical protein
LNQPKLNRRENKLIEASRGARADAEIERILAGEESLILSSGFLASVMERVQEEAVAPPPIPFPWKRAMPGILLASGVFGWAAVEVVRLILQAPASLTFTLPRLPATLAGPAEQALWIALALGVSFASWLLSRHLVGRGGLL